jgi:hypothetical protein
MSERFVPKVHPATRAVEPEDPLSLHATPAVGDPEVMLHCLVQEYAWMGWDGESILGLFRDPSHPVLNGLFERFGEPSLRERIAGVLANTGVLRFRESVREEVEPAEPELIELGIRLPAPRGGDCDA